VPSKPVTRPLNCITKFYHYQVFNKERKVLTRRCNKRRNQYREQEDEPTRTTSTREAAAMLKILKNKIAPFVYVSLFFVKDLPTGQAFSSGPPTRISIIPNKYEVTEKDTLCLSSPSIESLPAIAPLFLRVANFHSHFLRSTAAAIVTALLFMLTSLPALAADGDFFLQGNNGQTDPRKAKAMKQVVDLKTFQDSKLDACIGASFDFYRFD
jgi:hypothetical protein